MNLRREERTLERRVLWCIVIAALVLRYWP